MAKRQTRWNRRLLGGKIRDTLHLFEPQHADQLFFVRRHQPERLTPLPQWRGTKILSLCKSPVVTLSEARGPDDIRLYAVGDIHGCLGLLDKLLMKIEEDLTRSKPTDWRVIFLGDYVDRGSASKGVIDRLIDLKAHESRYIMLAGNHDLEFLGFLIEPNIGGVFVNCGGDATSRSYGVKLDPSKLRTQADLAEIHDKLVEAVPSSHVEFLRSLQLSVSYGDFFFCHAGVDPDIPLKNQDPDDLVWMRLPFLESSTPLEKVVVHGHTICEKPEERINRIGIDTGAYRTGRLTALMIDGMDRMMMHTK